MLKEVCVENFTVVPEAIQKGAGRIELCDNLAVGGTTVSLGVMEQTIRYCKAFSVPVMVIIRPRGGNFVYGETEKDIMLRDIQLAQKAGADGMVIGALSTENELDKPFLQAALDQSGQMDATFHMAFDEMDAEQQFKAIDWLSEAGFKRILTHGGVKTVPIEQNLNRLKELVVFADERIIIMPGGGVTADNVDKIQEKLNIEELHGTKIVGPLV